MALGNSDGNGVALPPRSLYSWDGTAWVPFTGVASAGTTQPGQFLAVLPTLADGDPAYLRVDQKGFGLVKLVDPVTDDVVQYSDIIQTKVVRPSITMDTAAYADGDTMGGLITLTDFARAAAGSGVLTRLQLRSILNITVQMFVHIFDANPTASTFTDNAAMVLNSADRSKLLKTIAVPAASWVAPKGVNPHYTFEAIDPSDGRLMLPYQLASGRDLYLAFEADGAIDFVAATDFAAIVSAENN